MCAILDADIQHEVFGTQTAAGKRFYKWIDLEGGRLVVGGKLKRELCGRRKFKEWLAVAEQSGSARLLDDEKIDQQTAALKSNTSYTFASNDIHVIALAQVSGARLLYTDDRKLRKDFKNNQSFDDKKGGKVYSRADHAHLLREAKCRNKQENN